MKKTGCLGWFLILVAVGAFINALSDPTAMAILLVAVILGVVAGVIFAYLKRRPQNRSAELLLVAGQLESWAAGESATGSAITKGDEVALFDLPGVELLEFKSSGSTYGGGNAGISFPIVGSLRGHVGGQRGQIIRNPEELMVSDTGTLKVTSKRLVYVGEKETREIAIAKLLDVELGPNGLWAKLAMSNKTKREGFQHMALDQITVGMAIGIANEWTKSGEATAKKYALSTAAEIRSILAAEAEAKAAKKR